MTRKTIDTSFLPVVADHEVNLIFNKFFNSNHSNLMKMSLSKNRVRSYLVHYFDRDIVNLVLDVIDEFYNDIDES